MYQKQGKTKQKSNQMLLALLVAATLSESVCVKDLTTLDDTTEVYIKAAPERSDIAIENEGSYLTFEPTVDSDYYPALLSKTNARKFKIKQTFDSFNIQSADDVFNTKYTLSLYRGYFDKGFYFYEEMDKKLCSHPKDVVEEVIDLAIDVIGFVGFFFPGLVGYFTKAKDLSGKLIGFWGSCEQKAGVKYIALELVSKLIKRLFKFHFKLPELFQPTKNKDRFTYDKYRILKFEDKEVSITTKENGKTQLYKDSFGTKKANFCILRVKDDKSGAIKNVLNNLRNRNEFPNIRKYQDLNRPAQLSFLHEVIRFVEKTAAEITAGDLNSVFELTSVAELMGKHKQIDSIFVDAPSNEIKEYKNLENKNEAYEHLFKAVCEKEITTTSVSEAIKDYFEIKKKERKDLGIKKLEGILENNVNGAIHINTFNDLEKERKAKIKSILIANLLEFDEKDESGITPATVDKTLRKILKSTIPSAVKRNEETPKPGASSVVNFSTATALIALLVNY